MRHCPVNIRGRKGGGAPHARGDTHQQLAETTTVEQVYPERTAAHGDPTLEQICPE